MFIGGEIFSAVKCQDFVIPIFMDTVGVGGNDDLSQQNMPTQGIFAVITHHQDGEAARYFPQ